MIGTAPVVGVAEPFIRWSWISDHYRQIGDALVQHLELTFVAVGVGFVLATVLAVFTLRFRVSYQPINALTGVMYAIPSLSLFILLVPITGLTTETAEIALISYTLQILYRSIVNGIDGVPESVVESASGMGYRRSQRFWQIELPLALPVIVSGVRIATVTTVGLVPVAAILGSDQGGLGPFMFDGLQRLFNTPLLVGGLLTVALAVVLDFVLVGLERWLTPWQRGRRTA